MEVVRAGLLVTVVPSATGWPASACTRGCAATEMAA
jgi:hypothetical protein